MHFLCLYDMTYFPHNKTVIHANFSVSLSRAVTIGLGKKILFHHAWLSLRFSVQCPSFSANALHRHQEGPQKTILSPFLPVIESRWLTQTKNCFLMFPPGEAGNGSPLLSISWEPRLYAKPKKKARFYVNVSGFSKGEREKVFARGIYSREVVGLCRGEKLRKEGKVGLRTIQAWAWKLIHLLAAWSWLRPIASSCQEVEKRKLFWTHAEMNCGSHVITEQTFCVESRGNVGQK